MQIHGYWLAYKTPSDMKLFIFRAYYFNFLLIIHPFFFCHVYTTVGVHNFSRNVEATSKFWAPGILRKAGSMLKIHRYWTPQYTIQPPRRPRAWDLCTPVLLIIDFISCFTLFPITVILKYLSTDQVFKACLILCVNKYSTAATFLFATLYPTKNTHICKVSGYRSGVAGGYRAMECQASADFSALKAKAF
jgi:hypothetical protein